MVRYGKVRNVTVLRAEGYPGLYRFLLGLGRDSAGPAKILGSVPDKKGGKKVFQGRPRLEFRGNFGVMFKLHLFGVLRLI